MTRTTLPPEARMHRPSEFAAALKGRRLARGAFFMVTSAPAGPEQGRARLGMVIAKRHAARAATRNAIKRVVREAFRARRLALPPGDYVVRLHARVPELSLTALKQAARAEADAHFARLVRCDIKASARTPAGPKIQ